MFVTTQEEMIRAAVAAEMTENLHSRWDGDGNVDEDK